MLKGKEGPAKQKAMELLVKYAEGLGADRFVDTNNATVAAAFLVVVALFIGIKTLYVQVRIHQDSGGR
jgi:hypothetical protein